MNIINNLKTATKLFGSFSLVNICMIAMTIICINSIQTEDGYVDTLYQDRLMPVFDLGQIDTQLSDIRGDAYQLLVSSPENTPKMIEGIRAYLVSIEERYQLYTQTQLTQAEIESGKKFETSWKEYQAALNEFLGMIEKKQTDNALATLTEGGRLANAYQTLNKDIDSLTQINIDESTSIWERAEAFFQGTRISNLVLALFSIALGITMAFLILNSFYQPLKTMSIMMDNISVGNLNRDFDQKRKDAILKRKDEIGLTAKALSRAELYLQDIAIVARSIAKGDLSMVVTPKSEKDELGMAFSEMIDGLSSTVGEISNASASVSSSSAQLADAANQAGQSLTQIAGTIQQIARGSSEQSEAASRTASSTDLMARAIGGVAKGAQDQANTIAKATTITNQISTGIQQVAKNAETVVSESNRAAKAANEGYKTVEDTLGGMNNIKDKVGLSASRVREMGQRSDQIGEIVTTINDIASQTNMLALNAAIEAARAGEAGKGFAVVADEVRKLAERSSTATKEIGDLIRSIQATVGEAVTAMNESAHEVENGVLTAGKAGDALNAILQAAEAVNLQAEQAAAAAEQISASTSDLVNSVDAFSFSVEENTAATEQISASFAGITQSVEHIASISEENSAAVEEVSASTEEISAQVEEVTASAMTLSDLAEKLDQVVKRFRLI